MTAAIRLSESMSDAEKTAIRRSLNATPSAPTVELVAPARGETVRDVLIAFRDGQEDLHGFPRHLVDFDALLAALERAEKR
jgi:hypothetical protein